MKVTPLEGASITVENGQLVPCNWSVDFQGESTGGMMQDALVAVCEYLLQVARDAAVDGRLREQAVAAIEAEERVALSPERYAALHAATGGRTEDAHRALETVLLAPLEVDGTMLRPATYYPG